MFTIKSKRQTMGTRHANLPFLPGYTFNSNIGRTKFPMDPKFDFIAPGVRALVDRVKPNLFGPGVSERNPSIYPRGEVLELPPWIVYDKHILVFDAYFQETLQEFPNAPFTIRNVKIYFYLEDGTIMVIEPKVDNSGISQGTMICRHRIRLPAPMDDNFYELLDFNIGKEVEFYGKIFKITNCDKFTRNFLNRLGVPVPDPIELPSDPYLEHRSKSEHIEKTKSCKSEDPLGKFLKNDKKILRFFGYWDDRGTEYGYIHHLELLLYLADDTIEIIERFDDGCGKIETFTFLRRDKLAKTFQDVSSKLGASCKRPLLNVLGTKLGGIRYVYDPLKCGTDSQDYYRENDLMIGAVINCYGRKIILTDLDNFTREYYRVKYGVDNFEKIEKPKVEKTAISTALKDRILPPWNGYGTFDDSAQNCKTVELKPLLKDLKQFLQLDREGLNSRVLRFEARMISKIPENCTRTFVINYFLVDDTIQIVEYAKRNSGFETSNKVFLARNIVDLPGQDPYKMSTQPQHYLPQDFHIGKSLEINCFKFRLINADEYALRYMELHPEQFPKSNIKLIMGKIREKLRPIYKDFVAENIPTENSTMPYKKLQEKLKALLGDDFTEHEMLTLARRFPGNPPIIAEYDRDKLRAITLTELKRFLWDDLDRLREYFVQADQDRCGKLTKDQCYTVIRACRLPLDKALINSVLKTIKKDENSLLYYDDILEFFNRKICPLPDVEPVDFKYELCNQVKNMYKPPDLIDWCAFNKYLDLESTFQ